MMMSCMTGQAAEAVPSCESSCLPVREGRRAQHHPAQATTTNNSGPTTATTTITTPPSQHLEACHPVPLLQSVGAQNSSLVDLRSPLLLAKALLRVGCSTLGCRLPTTATATAPVSSAFHPTHPPNLPFHILPVISSRVDTNPFQKVLIFQNLICYYLP